MFNLPTDYKSAGAVLAIIVLLSVAYVALRLLCEENKRRNAYERELIRQAREYKRAEELAYCQQFSEVAKECDYQKAEWIARQWVERFNDEG